MGSQRFRVKTFSILSATPGAVRTLTRVFPVPRPVEHDLSLHPAGPHASNHRCLHQKGVGKTTTAVNLATALALEDHGPAHLDPGQCVVGTLGTQVEVNVGVADVMLDFRDLPDAVVPTCVDGLRLLPATRELIGLEIELVEASRRVSPEASPGRLREPLRFVIIDASSAQQLTINGLASTRWRIDSRQRVLRDGGLG